MKTTLVIVGILIAGVVYADSRSTMREVPATYETSSPCCGPQPEDIRTYYLPKLGGGSIIIIPTVEGTNGFVLTDVLSSVSLALTIFQDTGEGPVEVSKFHLQGNVSLTAGMPLVVGSTISVSGSSSNSSIAFIGYVY